MLIASAKLEHTGDPKIEFKIVFIHVEIMFKYGMVVW